MTTQMRYAVLMVIVFLTSPSALGAEAVRVGSKAFTEGFLLAELAAQKLEEGEKEIVVRRFGLGNTGVVVEALKKGEIDFYPEYTGTMREAILHNQNSNSDEQLENGLKKLGLVMSEPLGFSNTYALAVTHEFAEEHGLKTISDLQKVKDLVRSAFSHEFTTRQDGLRGLLRHYRFELGGRRDSLEHTLSYEAIAERQVDLIDVYSTDAQIERLDLVVLEDDRDFFPSYEAVFLAREDFVERNPAAWKALNGLEDALDEKVMRSLNAGVEIDKKSFAAVIHQFLKPGEDSSPFLTAGLASRIWQRTREHAFLVGITVFLSVLTGVPLGILAVRREHLGQAILLGSSIVQTIPSLALLCLLIPLFGIGVKPALVALYLYALLPILLNTYIGLRSIDGRLLETAKALGLNTFQRIFWIELPLASRSIIGGIKTATIIGIGTATLAALIGAGGYGAPIVSGLAINDMTTVLTGAIPAAAMSLVAHFGFELLSRFAVPRGLR